MGNNGAPNSGNSWRPIAHRPDCVVLIAPLLDDDGGFRLWKISPLRHSSRSLPLKDSQ